MEKEPYYIHYDDYAGNHSRAPQTFIIHGPNGLRVYFRAENYGGSAHAAEAAARQFMKEQIARLKGDITVIHPINPPIDHICGQWTLDQLLGSEGKRP